jgi:O-antigen/teichoic acid export membrane protein
LARDGSSLGARVGSAVVLAYSGHAFALASGILVARLLGPTGKGALSLFVEAVYGLAVVANLGIGAGQLYVVSKDQQQLVHFMPNARLLSAALGLVSGLIVYGGTRFLGVAPTAGWDPATLTSAVLLSPVMLLQIFQRQYLLATGRYSGAKVQFVGSMLAPFLAYAILGFLHLANWQLFVRAFAGAQITWVVAMECAIAQLDGLRTVPSLKLVQASLGFGLKQYGTGVVQYLTTRVDFFLVAGALGSRALGIYSVAVALSEIVSRLSREIGNTLLPEFASGRLAPGDGPRVVRKTLLVAGSAGLATAVLGGLVVVGLFGRAFSEATGPLRLLLFGTVVSSTIEVTWPHTSARGRPELGMLFFGAAAGLDVVLNIVLLPHWGILGAAIAAVASHMVVAGLFLRAFVAAEGCTLATAVLPTGRDVCEVWEAILSISRGIVVHFRARM